MNDLRESIYEIARQYLGDSVRRTAGDHVSAVCPFHRRPDGTPERSPSFSMSLRSGLYTCFSCKASGTFERLLERFGIPPVGVEGVVAALRENVARKPTEQRDGMAFMLAAIDERAGEVVNTPLPEQLLGLFQYLPEDLEAEGFTEETLAYFNIGVDLRHERTTYPIRDHEGTLVGISGRARAGQRARYKVYTYEYEAFGLPERDLQKSHLLWNYHRVAQMELGRDVGVVLVEGFKAAMWLHQAGYHGVVALMGSSMSREQCTLLTRLGRPIFIMLDNDDAGRKGTIIAAEQLQKEQVEVSIVQYEAKQPSDIPVEQLHHVMTDAITYVDWVFEQHPTEKDGYEDGIR